MIRILVFAALVGATLCSAPAAIAGAIDDIVNFCTSDTNAPADEAIKLTTLPNGSIRGGMSAQQAAREAWVAVKAADAFAGQEPQSGKLRNRAIQWLLICQAHDEGSRNVIAADNNAALAVLRGWTPAFADNGM